MAFATESKNRWSSADIFFLFRRTLHLDLEMKAKALATCEVHGTSPRKHWKNNVALMQFLRSL